MPDITPGFGHCSGGPVPCEEGFTCPSGQTCLWTAAKTTLLCCPPGFACNKLESIPCDITFQDANKHPESVLKTVALSCRLPTCREKCCPFGYTCDAEGNCIRDADQSKPPASFEFHEPQSGSSIRATMTTTLRVTTLASSVTTVRVTATASSDHITTTDTATVTSTAPAPTEPTVEHGNIWTPPAIVAIALVGATVLVVAVLSVLFWGQRKKRKGAATRAVQSSLDDYDGVELREGARARQGDRPQGVAELADTSTSSRILPAMPAQPRVLPWNLP
ncbi:hypothetical protein OQA88_13515 [Cercophora sp. LCS_1]